jgi:hypothetical protein
MRSMCRNIYIYVYRLLFVTFRDKRTADKYVQRICYPCPAKQSLVYGVGRDESNLSLGQFWLKNMSL